MAIILKRTIMANSPARKTQPSIILSPNRSRRFRLFSILEAATTVEVPCFNISL
jgi:hypothetical protein